MSSDDTNRDHDRVVTELGATETASSPKPSKRRDRTWMTIVAATSVSVIAGFAIYINFPRELTDAIAQGGGPKPNPPAISQAQSEREMFSSRLEVIRSVDSRGIEPRSPGCKPGVFPLLRAAHFVLSWCHVTETHRFQESAHTVDVGNPPEVRIGYCFSSNLGSSPGVNRQAIHLSIAVFAGGPGFLWQPHPGS
jgi:hypothetical protein